MQCTWTNNYEDDAIIRNLMIVGISHLKAFKLYFSSVLTYSSEKGRFFIFIISITKAAVQGKFFPPRPNPVVGS